MTQKVLFFTADSVPTESELASIANLESYAEPLLDVNVRNGGDTVADNGYSSGPEPADGVAGTIPPEYSEYPVIDPDTSAATVVNGSPVTILDGSGENAPGTATVSSGNLDDVKMTQGTDAIVKNEDVFVDGTGTYTITVAGGEITAIAYVPV